MCEEITIHGQLFWLCVQKKNYPQIVDTTIYESFV